MVKESIILLICSLTLQVSAEQRRVTDSWENAGSNTVIGEILTIDLINNSGGYRFIRENGSKIWSNATQFANNTVPYTAPVSGDEIMHLSGSLAGSITAINDDLGGAYSLSGSSVTILKSDQGVTWEFLDQINLQYSTASAVSSHPINTESPSGTGNALVGFVNFNLTATSSEASSSGKINLRLQQANPTFTYFTFPNYVAVGNQFYTVDNVQHSFSNWDADKTEPNLNPFSATVSSTWTLNLEINYSKYDSTGNFIENETQSSSYTYNNIVGYSP